MAAFLAAVPPMVKSIAATGALIVGVDAAMQFGPKLFRNERSGALRDQRALFAQAALNRMSNLGLDQMYDVAGEMFDTRDQFFANTFGQANQSMARLGQRTAEVGGMRDLLFGRADMIRQASMRTTPHPLELLAGIQSVIR